MTAPLYRADGPLPVGRVVLEAGAGAGRTHTLAEVAGRLVAAGQPATGVLLISPRRHGLRALRAALPPAAAEATLLTIDGLALACARRFGALMGLDGVQGLTPMGDVGDAEAVLADYWGRVVVRAPAHRVRPLSKVSPDAIARLAALAEAAPDATLHPTSGELTAPLGLARAVCQAARAEGASRRAARRHPTAADVWARVLAVLDTAAPGAALRRAAQRTWQAVLVDDAHGLDPAALAGLRALFDDGRTPLWLAVDPRQRLPLTDVDRLRGDPPTPPPSLTLAVNHRADAALAPALAALFDPERLGEAAALPGRTALPATGATPAPDGGPAAFTVAWVHDPAADLARAEAQVAACCAADVAALLSAGAYGPDDVAVIVRTDGQAAALQGALRAAGVPNARVGGRSVFHAAVADDLALWLTAIDERSPAVIRAALSTPLGGYDGAAILALADDEVTWSHWLDQVRELSALWHDAGILPMVQHLRAVLDLPARWLRHPDGARRLTDLRHLAERLHAEAAGRALRPSALLAWFEQVRAAADPPLAGLRAERAHGAVRVLTPSRARDGEWAAVFAPCFWQAEDDPSTAVWHTPEGAQLDLRAGRDLPAAARRAAAADRLRWARRAVYVALSRARHHAVVYWGALPDAGRSPLAALLHPQPLWADRVADHVNRSTPEALRAELDALAALPGVAIAPAGADPTARWAAPAATLVPAARFPERRLDTQWGRTSFSGLTRDAPHAVQAGADEPEPEGVTPAPEATSPLPLTPVPPGAVTGTYLHGVLEHWDFQAPAALPQVVAAGLERHGLPATWAPPVVAGLQAAAQVPLTAGGPRLADIGRGDRLDELDFVLPVDAPIDGGTLARVLQRIPGPGLPPGYVEHLSSLPSGAVHGFLSGSIDLVFRHRGRWFVVDYKSNRLGDTPSDYTPDRLTRAMMDGHYVLQAHLYAVALHRLLALRLGPAYDPHTQLGGVAWLFLRGMTPGAAPGTGVWAAQLPVARIDALSAELAGRPVPAAPPPAQISLALT